MAKKSGTLIVRSNPSYAIVTIDSISKTTPAVFDLKSKALPYNVKIEKVGYDDYIHKVIIQDNVQIEINIVLTKTM